MKTKSYTILNNLCKELSTRDLKELKLPHLLREIRDMLGVINMERSTSKKFVIEKMKVGKRNKSRSKAMFGSLMSVRPADKPGKE